MIFNAPFLTKIKTIVNLKLKHYEDHLLIETSIIERLSDILIILQFWFDLHKNEKSHITQLLFESVSSLSLSKIFY